MVSIYYVLIASIVAYLLGSIPGAVWYGKAIYGIDVREHGSGNAGATNTLRILGKKAGLLVLSFDFLKGFAAANLLLWAKFQFPGLTDYMGYQILFGSLAVTGHIYPVFAGFKGGKGIATLIGVVTAIDYKLALLCFITFFVIVLVTRYISLGSIISAVVSPLYAGLLHQWQQQTLILFCCGVAILVLYTHRSNIKRLAGGNENKFSFNKKQTAA